MGKVEMKSSDGNTVFREEKKVVPCNLFIPGRGCGLCFDGACGKEPCLLMRKKDSCDG